MEVLQYILLCYDYYFFFVRLKVTTERLQLYKLIAILRRQYRIILAASWEKIYSRIGQSREATEPNTRIYFLQTPPL